MISSFQFPNITVKSRHNLFTSIGPCECKCTATSDNCEKVAPTSTSLSSDQLRNDPNALEPIQNHNTEEQTTTEANAEEPVPHKTTEYPVTDDLDETTEEFEEDKRLESFMTTTEKVAVDSYSDSVPSKN